MRRVSTAGRIVSVLSSASFFWAVVGLLAVQAAWLALSGRYPMAFDEDFHLGIIRLYAHHLSPFWGQQPPGADMFGAVARDPSYLYHWLMSIPYRLISLLTGDQTIQVLWLRFINIGLFAGGLVLFRRFLRRSSANDALVNLSCLILVLLPVIPLLAAQINYDNLLFPLTAICLLLTQRLSHGLRQQQPLDVRRWLLLFSLCLLTSLVKYAFLPLFLGIVVYLIIRLRQSYPDWRKFIMSLGFGWTLLNRWQRWLLPLLLLISVGLFSQRYVVNSLTYHTPIPDCSRVLDVEACSDYGPWIRDYTLTQTKVASSHSPLVFTNNWLYGMWLRLLFAVDGPATDFQTRGPLVLPALVVMVYPVMALMLIVRYGRRIWRRYDPDWLGLVIVTTVAYVGALWLDEYRAFLRTGQPVAINGRYLLPVLLPAMLIGAMAANEWLGSRRQLKLLLAAVAVLGLIWGGGALTYILRSNGQWYWSNSTVESVNHRLQTTLGPIVPGYRNPTQFLP